MKVRLAAVNWKLRRIRGDNQYFGHMHDLVSAAHGEGAEIVVLPELHLMELLPLAGEALKERNAAKYLVQYESAIEEWLVRIAKNSGLTIVGGSHLKRFGEEIRNVCAVARPDGTLFFGEKNVLTTYEKNVWRLESGAGLLRWGPFGVTICYDCEFPPSGRALAEAGALVHLIPAWTETEYGFHRVRWSAKARALEHQVFAVHASLVGDLGKEPVPESYGSSAVLTPSCPPFPVSGVLRESAVNEEEVIVADLDLGALRRARARGDVRNWHDRDKGDWTVHGPDEDQAADPSAN